MDEYVKDYNDRREEDRREKTFSKARWLWVLVFLLILFFVLVFPHKQYVYSSGSRTEVLGVNAITGIACYLKLEKCSETIDGEKTSWYKTKENKMIIVHRDKVLGEEVYYNESEDILVEVDDKEEDSEFGIFEIFFQTIFNKEQFKKQAG